MNKQVVNLTILCKVVDNFGDIGVVYRLMKSLAQLDELCELKMRLVIDDLLAFQKIEPRINPEKSVQILPLDNNQPTSCAHFDFQAVRESEIQENLSGSNLISAVIYNSNDSVTCFDAFSKNPPQIIIECFQCGRPDWLENLLFEEKVPNIVQIIMLDYLTAESYAETFHCLQSLTRSARVKKVNFMPGFTKKTGGLLLPLPHNEKISNNSKKNDSIKNIFFFSYNKPFNPIIAALQKYNELHCQNNLNVYLAQGQGFTPFQEQYSAKTEYTDFQDESIQKRDALRTAEKKLPTAEQNHNFFKITPLPFISQAEWDFLLPSCDILFIRGEDSLAQACLSGKPFIWNAYPQTEEYQLVKVNALLEKMQPFFSESLYQIVKNAFLLYNITVSIDESFCESFCQRDLLPNEFINETPENLESQLESVIYDFLENSEKMRPCFEKFAENLKKNGDLAAHLMTFILKNCIME